MSALAQARVFLVGAGPGDPELITLKAIRALQQADVVLYDFLAHPNLLHHCASNAELICVGKKKGYHRQTQDSIHEMLLEQAKKGRQIVRLKGGDPLTFGRGGEEMAFLKAQGIAYEVIPGVSSTIAGPAYAGIPLTHRDLSRSVAVVTGAPRAGETVTAINLPEADTVVVVMPVTHLSYLCDQFSQQSRFSPETPAALLHHMSTADQSVLAGTLATLPDLAIEQGVVQPSLLIVGDVVSCRDQLAWRETLPLFGQRVVMLRTVLQGKSLTATLQSLGAEVFSVPILDIVSRETDQQRVTPDFLSQFSTLVFTSPNGVRQFMRAVSISGTDSRGLAGKSLIAIGPKTAQVLLDYGLRADHVPEQFQSEGVLALLPESLTDESILIPTALKNRGVLSQVFRDRGAAVTELPLYETVLPDLPDQAIRDGDFVVFTSSSMARHFFESSLYHGQKIVSFCIGEITHRTVKGYQVDWVVLAATPTESALKDAILDYAMQLDREVG